MVEYPESNLVMQTACPKCPSSDAYSLYDDGHGYCYSCGHRSAGNNDTQKPQEKFMQLDLIQGGEISPLRKRGIHLDTTTKFKYEVGNYKGKTCQIANYIKDGSRVAQKIRFPNKDFLFIGDTKQVGLYGQWLFNGGGRMVVCCEGEIDTLTVSQVFGNKYPVVGVPTGAQGAKRAIQKNLEWLCKYETVVFAFDMDKPGQDAALECAALLPPGMAKIAHLEMKDPNDMLKAGKVKQLSGSIWEAKAYQPDGILNGKDLWEMVSTEDKTESKAYPYEGLNRMTRGIRRNEIVTVTAGSGIGKSQLVREIFHHLLTQGETIGYIALEENVKRTALGLMSLAINKPLHLGTQHVTKEELKVAFDSTLGTGRVYLYDHWGSTETDNLLNKIRYLATTGGCSYIALDHISICVSGLEGGDERRIIDNLMTNIRSLCEELSIGIVLVSHLKRPAGDKGHEEGARTNLAQLRGSASIGQLSDIVVGCERDQQSMDHGDITTVRILKNRWTGETGVCSMLKYDRVTGRMTEMMLPDVEEPEAGSPFENMDIEEEQAWA
jgi:twinkle protein